MTTEVTKNDSKNESITKESNSVRNSLLTSSSLNGQSALMMNSLENHLTIAAMVASIAQDKNYSLNKLNKSSALKASTNSDKENEHESQEASEAKSLTTTSTTTIAPSTTTTTNSSETTNIQPEKKLLNDNTLLLNNDHNQVSNVNSNANSTTDDSLSKINASIVLNKHNVDAYQPLNLKVKKPKLIKPKKPIEANDVEKKTSLENVENKNALENSEKPKKVNVNKQSTVENPTKKMRPSQSKKQLKAKANEESESKTPSETANCSQGSNQPLNLSQSQYPGSKTPNNTNNSNSQHASTTNTQPQMPIMPSNFNLMPMSLMNHLMCANKQWNNHYDYANQAANFSNFQSTHQVLLFFDRLIEIILYFFLIK